MTVPVAYRGRLPGVRCDPALPRRVDETIRLDGTALVGFAERGPVDDPVLVEDPTQYTTAFGGDLPLAFDENGVPQYAALPEAVRSFFDNGGRRAWVVRVVGAGAVTVDVPVRVTSRLPLGDSTAITGLDGPTGPWVELAAASPGGWARAVTVDVDVIDTVLALTTASDGTVALTRSSERLLDEGDVVLVRRGAQWLVLEVPAPSDTLAPPDGWHEDDVARLLRLDVTVRRAGDRRDVARAVEQFTDLRLRPGAGPSARRSRAWTDVLQPADGGYRSDRSQYLRAPTFADLHPVVGPAGLPVPDAVAPAVPEPGTRLALEPDGLDTFDPVALFLDPGLRGHTVEGLALALELLGLADDPLAHGVHAVALEPDVAMVAVPDLYHRPWTEQAVLTEPDMPEPLPEVEPNPVGFSPCSPPVPPARPAVRPDPLPPAELRLVTDPPAAYDPAGLHEVVGALADLCAARADLVAVFALPRHAGTADARDLAGVVTARHAAVADVASYTGIWLPWGAVAERTSPDASPLRPVPPDGAVAGCIAATELARGVWVEPASRPLAGFLDADGVDPPTALDLFDRGLNVVRRRPAGFTATSAHSASADRSLLQLSVRRLLILVRKLALREGTRYVFEPDDERFRAQVTATFTRALERLRVEGALVAYAVEVEPLATRSAADEGKVRIDLKLAPTSPIEFITVSLLRSGDALVPLEVAR